MWLWVTLESPICFFQFRLNIKYLWQLPVQETPLNSSHCCHSLADLSLCPFLSANGVAAPALNHEKGLVLLVFQRSRWMCRTRVGERFATTGKSRQEDTANTFVGLSEWAKWKRLSKIYILLFPFQKKTSVGELGSPALSQMMKRCHQVVSPSSCCLFSLLYLQSVHNVFPVHRGNF